MVCKIGISCSSHALSTLPVGLPGLILDDKEPNVPAAAAVKE